MRAVPALVPAFPVGRDVDELHDGWLSSGLCGCVRESLRLLCGDCQRDLGQFFVGEVRYGQQQGGRHEHLHRRPKLIRGGEGKVGLERRARAHGH